MRDARTPSGATRIFFGDFQICGRRRICDRNWQSAIKGNEVNIQLPIAALQASVKSPVAANDIGSFEVASNVARDILKRARAFESNADAVFEYIANAFESYNVGQVPKVFCTITKDKITIVDHGVGMSAESFRRLWMMHGETKRRLNGLNRRGYNGTGKIAGLRCALKLSVSTVHNGVRQAATLSLSEVNLAASQERMPSLSDVVYNEATTARNGTTITLEVAHKDQFPEGFNAEFIRAVRTKIASEKMMWMKMGDVYVNGTPVEALEVPFDRKETIHSECGHFVVELFFLEKGYQDELQDVHMKIGGIFVAAEKFGKEGHRLANRVYVLSDTTGEWCEEHFEGQRENFMSESRDLKFKCISAAGKAYKKFVTDAVSNFLKQLEESEEARRKALIDEQTRIIETRMCDFLSAVHNRVRRNVRSGTGVLRGSYSRNGIVERANRQTPRPRISFRTDAFSNSDERYRYDLTNNEITINTRFPHMMVLAATGKKTYATEQALLETGIAAYAEMECEREMREKFEEASSLSLKQMQEASKQIRSAIEHTAYRLAAGQFDSFKRMSVDLGETLPAAEFDFAEGV